MNSKLIVVLSLAVAHAGLAGCGVRGPAAAQTSPSQGAAVRSSEKSPEWWIVSFKKDVLPALQESCLPCHYDKKQMPGLDFSSANAYADLVNRKSNLDASLVLVKPSSVPESFVVEKLSLEPRYGATMPPYGRPLTPAEKTLLSQWIEQGAKDN